MPHQQYLRNDVAGPHHPDGNCKRRRLRRRPGRTWTVRADLSVRRSAQSETCIAFRVSLAFDKFAPAIVRTLTFVQTHCVCVRVCVFMRMLQLQRNCRMSNVDCGAGRVGFFFHVVVRACTCCLRIAPMDRARITHVDRWLPVDRCVAVCSLLSKGGRRWHLLRFLRNHRKGCTRFFFPGHVQRFRLRMDLCACGKRSDVRRAMRWRLTIDWRKQMCVCVCAGKVMESFLEV